MVYNSLRLQTDSANRANLGGDAGGWHERVAGHLRVSPRRHHNNNNDNNNDNHNNDDNKNNNNNNNNNNDNNNNS